MASDVIKYFGECHGEPVQLLFPTWADFKRQFAQLLKRSPGPDEKLVRNCQLFALGSCPICGAVHPATRVIHYAKQPSRHQCNGKCLSARGPLCECSCGGKNHGAGYILSGSLFA
jgi:hypothetical protein